MATQFLAHLDLVSPLTSFVAEGENGLPVVTGGKAYRIEFEIETPAEGNRKLFLRMEAESRRMLQQVQKCIELFSICGLLDAKSCKVRNE